MHPLTAHVMPHSLTSKPHASVGKKQSGLSNDAVITTLAAHDNMNKQDHPEMKSVKSFIDRNRHYILYFFKNVLITLISGIVVYYIINGIGNAIRKHPKSHNNKNKNVQHKITYNVVSIMIQAVLYGAYVLFLIYIWGFHVLSVLAMIGTLLLALSLGLQGIVTNFAAGILIAAQHQYHIGDVIETNAASASPTLGGGVMGNMTGVVKRFDLFHTELMDINTHVLHKIRNADLYAGIITNYSQVNRLIYSFDIHCSTNNDLSKVLHITDKVVSEHPVCIQDKELPSPASWIRSDDGQHGGGVRVGVKFYMHPNDYIRGKGYDVQTKVFQALQQNNVRFIETNTLLQVPASQHMSSSSGIMTHNRTEVFPMTDGRTFTTL